MSLRRPTAASRPFVCPEAIAIVAVGVALLSVLVPLLLVAGHAASRPRAPMWQPPRIELRADVAELRREVRTDLAEVGVAG